MSKQSFSFMESIIAIGALVTSSAAVYIAWDQANVMHTEQKATVLPAIQIDRFELDEGSTVSVGFNIENAGVGPAFLQSATLTNKSEAVQGQEHLTSELPYASELSVAIEQMSGRVLAPGVQKQAMLLRWRSDPLEPSSRSQIYTKTDGLALEVCYCSTLGIRGGSQDQCWISKSGQRAHPKVVAKCSVPKEGLF
jgi:hypothetical protein